MYTVSQKKQDSKLLPITYPLLTDFQIVFAGRLNGKFATASDINIPPHLNMSLYVKYECQKTDSKLKYVLRLMINHNVL